VATILFFIYWQSSQQDELNVSFFDVGQGDAILIRTPSHQNIVIDGGPDNSFITKLGLTLPFYDRIIDLMILTHPHDDHLFGLVEVLKRYQVKQVLYSGVLHTTDAYLEWLNIIKEKKIPFTISQAGQKFIFYDLELTVIFPFELLINQPTENLNETSVVIQLAYNDIKILFTGDLEALGEAEIIKSSVFNLKSNVLKLGHHGSDTSSSLEFLQAVNPEFAVISVGQDNKFGHPSVRIIKKLERQNIKILRTDLSGDIGLATNGQTIWLK